MSSYIKLRYPSTYPGDKSDFQLYNSRKIGKLTFNVGGEVQKRSYWFVPEGDFVNELSFEVKNLYETVTNKGGGFNPLKSLESGLASLSGADHFASQFINLPEQTSFNIGISGSLKLNFAYGLQNAFNAKKEVVNPILEILQMFFPNYEDSIVKGPYASSGRILIEMFKNLKDSLNVPSAPEFHGDASAQNKQAQGFIDQLNQVGRTIVAEFDKIAADTYVGDKVSTRQDIWEAGNKDYGDDQNTGVVKSAEVGTLLKTCNIEIGNMIYKNLFATGVSWQFNTENVDASGYPMKGYVELKSPQFIMLPALGSKYNFIEVEGVNEKKPIAFGGTFMQGKKTS